MCIRDRLYCEQEIEEYWIVDWRKKTVEIYELDYEGEIPKYYLLKTVTEENKDELQLLHFPKIKITFDELLDVYKRQSLASPTVWKVCQTARTPPE